MESRVTNAIAEPKIAIIVLLFVELVCSCEVLPFFVLLLELLLVSELLLFVELSPVLELLLLLELLVLEPLLVLLLEPLLVLLVLLLVSCLGDVKSTLRRAQGKQKN